MRSRKSILVLLASALIVTAIGAQQNDSDLPSSALREIGDPFLQNYDPDNNYKGFYQNWDIVQDSLGIIYFANGDGVLSYDGVHWELLELPHIESVFSLAIDADGRIFVGGQGELGYLQTGVSGQLQYRSLLPLLPDDLHDFYVIWNTHATPEGVYFDSKKYLLRWDGKEFKVWKNDTGEGQRSLYVNNTLFSNHLGKGLMQLVSEEFESVPGGDRFAQSSVRFMIPYDKQRILLGTNDGLFIYDGKKFDPFLIERPDFFNDRQLYSGLLLPDSTIALGSMQKGIMVVDRQGRQLSHITKEDGLLSNQVTRLFSDRSGILWATLFTGISKVEYPSPFSTFSGKNVDGSVIFAIERFNGRVLVATSTGLYVLETKEADSKAQLAIFSDEVGNIWDMVHFEDRLLVGGDKGVFEVDERNQVKLISKIPVNCLERSKLNDNRIFMGLSPGVGTLVFNSGNWNVELINRDISEEVPEILELQDGTIWLGTDLGRLVKLSFGSKQAAYNFQNPVVTYYMEDKGIPKDVGKPYLMGNKVYFHIIIGDKKGSLYLYDPQADRFKFDATFYESLDIQNDKVAINNVDKSGNIWLTTYEETRPMEMLLATRQPNGTIKARNLDASRILGKRKGGRYGELKDSIIWHGFENGVLRHDLKKRLNPSNYAPKVHIAKVHFQTDSLLYFGRTQGTVANIPFKRNEFRFEYALPSYHNEESNQYQYFLKGFDSEWSNWSLETKKDFTSLPEGDYSFKVRAKNSYGLVGGEDSYDFTILPPWYRSWIAYTLYLIGGILLLVLSSQWRSQQLRKKNLALESIVDERTEEIRHKNKLLSYQASRLKEMDTMKTRLFANISHEFRTPLTLIKGPIEKLESGGKNQISTPNIKMIRRNANRLLNLVNQLLDLSKLDSGKLKLNEAEGDVMKCIRAAASAFSSHAASRSMDYQIKIPSRLLWASFDRDKLEKILYNLLSNAFKFTEDEGKVIIETEFRSSRLRLKVSDSGSGIAAGKLPHIFDRFFQVDDSYTKEKAGSGIGLALTKELVELMGGTIYVESEQGKGSLFRVVIPLDEIHTHHLDTAVSEMPVVLFDDDHNKAVPQVNEEKEAKILVIEDNNDMRHFVREQLADEYQIYEASNGMEGFQDANKLTPDLIITDLMMPKMDGITLCKKLKTNLNTSHIPVIMLTAKAGLENKLEGLETGADDYLTKPFVAKELQIRVWNLIQQRQQLREHFSKNISLDPKAIAVTSLDEEFLQSVLTLFERQYADSQFGVPQIQKQLGMSKTSLHTKIRALTNHPPGELLRNFRLKRASQLLSQKGDNISQVAYDVGFNSLSYFTRCFREFFHMSPSEFIKKKDVDS